MYHASIDIYLLLLLLILYCHQHHQHQHQHHSRHLLTIFICLCLSLSLSIHTYLSYLFLFLSIYTYYILSLQSGDTSRTLVGRVGLASLSCLYDSYVLWLGLVLDVDAAFPLLHYQVWSRCLSFQS